VGLERVAAWAGGGGRLPYLKATSGGATQLFSGRGEWAKRSHREVLSLLVGSPWTKDPSSGGMASVAVS
jgi:hypothetical protein